MATSGVVTFDPTLADLVEDASTLAGFESRTGYDFKIARYALNTLFQEWSNRGINLWALASSTIAPVVGQATYNLPTDCMDVFEVVWRTNAGGTSQFDRPLSRLSNLEYTGIANKLEQGTPSQFLVNRLVTPTLTVWQTPDTTSGVFALYYLRRFSDAGNGANTQDVPARFFPVLSAGLAYHMALRRPELADRISFLKQHYEEQWQLAAEEDREKVPMRIVPRIG